MKWTVCLVAQEVRLKDSFHLIIRDGVTRALCVGVGLTTIGLFSVVMLPHVEMYAQALYLVPI